MSRAAAKSGQTAHLSDANLRAQEVVLAEECLAHAEVIDVVRQAALHINRQRFALTGMPHLRCAVLDLPV